MVGEIREYDEIEGLRHAIMLIVQRGDEVQVAKLKEAMDLLLSGASQIGTIFQRKCSQQPSQQQARKAKPPQASSRNGPQQQKRPPSNTDTPKTQNAAQKRPEELSRIQQGIRLADPSLADQQRALRGKVYGAQNDEVAFRKAAQAIAR